MTRPLLTVGIPTWNRVELLRDTILSVTEQADRHGVHERVEVVVCDNASTDATPAVVAEIAAASRTPVRYHRAERNVGPVRNVLWTLELAAGEFWMMFGDDDVMVDGALPRILEALDAQADCAGFLFQQQPTHPYFAFAEGFRLRADEAAERFFYYAGNAGVFAVDAPSARRIAQREGAAAYDTCWPQTQLMFQVLAEARAERPVYAAPFAAASSPHHAGNTLYSSTYLWETMVDGLYRAAVALRPSSPAVARAALRHLFAPRRVASLALSIAQLAAFQETEADTRRTRAAVAARLRAMPRPLALATAPIWAVLALPAPARRGLLAGYVRLRHPFTAGALLGEWRSQRREFLARQAAAGAGTHLRDYADTGF